jgi:hypothetical protein
MRPLGAVFADATALFADASALMRRTRGIRQELEAATATGADEAERLVHGVSRPGSKPDSFRVRGCAAGLPGSACGGAEPPWLRRLLDSLNPRREDTG